MEMTKEQAVETLRKLASLFPTGPLSSEVAREQYLEVLLKMDNELTQEALHQCLMNSRYCPTIADIRYAYLNLLKNTNANQVRKYVKCSKCNGNGFFLYHQVQDGVSYQVLAYCSCEAGNDYRFSTNNYRTRLFTEIMPESHWKPQRDEFDDMPVAEIKKQVKNFLVAASRW